MDNSLKERYTGFDYFEDKEATKQLNVSQYAVSLT